MGSVSNSSRQDLRCPRGVFAGLLPSIYKILSRLSRYCRILRGLSVIWRNSENSSRTVFAVSRIRSLPPQSPAPISMRFCNTPQTDCGGGRRGDSATVRVLRCSWNCGSARITAAASRGDAESAGSKTSACWNRYAGIAVGSLYGNGQFPKVPHVLLRRFDVLKKIRLSSRRLPFVPILLGKAASARTRRLRNRAGSAMFLEPRSGADSGGGVKGRRRDCGFKKLPPVGTGTQE